MGDNREESQSILEVAACRQAWWTGSLQLAHCRPCLKSPGRSLWQTAQKVGFINVWTAKEWAVFSCSCSLVCGMLESVCAAFMQAILLPQGSKQRECTLILQLLH